MTSRFEFRVFGEDLSAERAVLEARAGKSGDEETRTDTYFVVQGRTDSSLKLRGGGLDLKVLRDCEDGLERWQPAGEAEFPVEPERLQDTLLGPAGLPLDLPGAPVGRDLLLMLARDAVEVRLVRVEKRRRQYRLDGAAAEFTRLRVDGRNTQTVAVEAAEPDSARDAVAALGLSGRRNTSYQRFLVELLFPASAVPRARNAGDGSESL